MKKLLLSAAFIAASFTSIAQVGVGTASPDASAALEIESTTLGLLPPRMTTVERDLINSGAPAEGLTIYNTDTKCLELYNGTDWISVCSGSVVTTSNSNGDATFSLPQTHTLLSLFDSGTPVYIQGVVDGGANIVTYTVPYTSGSGSYDAYTSATVLTNEEGGGTHLLTISYPAGTFSASGNITVTVNVTDGNGSLNVEKQGLGAITTFASLDFKVNGNSKGNLLLDAIGGIPDRNFADANHKFIYVPITNVDGKVWLNNNLGANYSNLNNASFSPTTQAQNSADYNAYGSLIQWGRYSDGHELINWTSGAGSDGTEQSRETSTISTTTTVPVADQPKFILVHNTTNPPLNYYNWYTGTSANDLWQGEAGTNNVCPQGYKVPTAVEWDSVRLTNDLGATVTTNNWGTATNYGNDGAAGGLASTLKLPLAGQRRRHFGEVRLASTGGEYFTSSAINTTEGTTDVSRMLIRSDNASMGSTRRAYGMSVRCLKD
jgi:uncharacterized protein (TIGR02145 family)